MFFLIFKKERLGEEIEMEFYFYANGVCWYSEAGNRSLSADRRGETEAGGRPEEVVAHLHFSTTNPVGTILKGIVETEKLVAREDQRVLLDLLSEAFRAGVKHGKKK
ncbi:hypothetical protein IT399_00505 [Candidatus Nomurabacteria bacterium]|nr:hypothetical protein [Candidatus Nomurabacteria bacterium]